MSENEKNEHSEETHDRFDGNMEAQDLATTSMSKSSTPIHALRNSEIITK
jgi:hypothetical protein